MAYSGRTSFYNIPIALNGDILDESENQQQMRMIDNFLEAATGVIGTGVIQEGLFSTVADTGSGHKVLLDPVAGISIKGLLNSGLINSASQIAWTDLQTGNFYFLYLQFTTELYEDETKFTIVSKTDLVDSSNFNYLFMATVDLTGSPILDSDPEGKVYSSEFRTHTGTQFNPHTNFLTQTNLSVTGSISGNLNSNETLRINQEFATSIQPLITFNHATSGVPVMRSIDEFVLGDLRTTTQLSASGQVGFDNLRPSILGAINENWGVLDSLLSSITGNIEATAVNTGNIALNSANIVQNTGDLSQNSSDIQINTIQSNTQAATNISQAVSIANNIPNIIENAVNIIPNTALVLGNTNDIATNTSNVVSLTGQVSINSAAIGLHGSQTLNLGGRVVALECDVFALCPSSSSSSSL